MQKRDVNHGGNFGEGNDSLLEKCHYFIQNAVRTILNSDIADITDIKSMPSLLQKALKRV